ncbi:MAG: LCP family protein [Firmicutes bacterium]|nr:LCP family protein [Bacillota bacterium]
MNLAQEPHQPEEQTTKKEGRARARRVIFLAIVLVLLMASGLAYRYWTEMRILGDESINIVFIGVDTPFWEQVEAKEGLDSYPAAFSQFGYGADALAIGTINPIDKSMHFVSLPANLLAILPEGNVGQLKDVFAAGGVPATQKALEELLNIPVHHYVLIDYGGFTRLVDTIGGVELFVAEPIRYYDDGELVFELETGTHRLDGAEALKFVRYLPGANSERDRLERQQEFLGALGNQLFHTATLSQLPKLAKLADELVETDLRWEEALQIAGVLLRQKRHSFSVMLLPMDETDSESVPDSQAIRALVDGLFHNPTWVK